MNLIQSVAVVVGAVFVVGAVRIGTRGGDYGSYGGRAAFIVHVIALFLLGGLLIVGAFTSPTYVTGVGFVCVGAVDLTVGITAKLRQRARLRQEHLA